MVNNGWSGKVNRLCVLDNVVLVFLPGFVEINTSIAFELAHKHFFSLYITIFLARYDKPQVMLTHWGRDKKDTISLTTFSSSFSWMKIFEFRLKFHWSLFLTVPLTIFQHWFRQWLGADQATSHCLNQWWFNYWRIYASLGLNGLRGDLARSTPYRVSLVLLMLCWWRHNYTMQHAIVTPSCENYYSTR